jgi:hypothetical protein
VWEGIAVVVQVLETDPPPPHFYRQRKQHGIGRQLVEKADTRMKGL